ncbi:50S ribosomal protein L24 [Magnetospirillum sulfuroxidans]|uniref:Large ribosomal subunit protein uL24 n=1 Tax=Magnetospirillum sulfuroxidans TaxID=611300 RepID=A0ABS5IAV5_9PROT|nr:50S ribosomal protein L24 [Magnetospirillum sulfuroxidans]MBR9971520.1 50S ribosomal protein L24 [Magnetospirillum sulfuroxidans]
MAGLNVKKGDQVIVIAGKDKGKKGEIIAAYPKEERVVVQGVNKVKRHVRPSAANAGGIVEQEAALHVSNVAHVDPKDGKPTRVGVKILEDGRKVRVAKRSGEVIDR